MFQGGIQLGGSQISVGQSTINNLDSEDYDIKKKMSLIFLGTMAAETKIEEERLKLSENNEFYPEKAFQFLKTFSSRIQETQKFQSFFDFSAPNDVMEYNQLNSYKSGFVAYKELQSLLDFYKISCTDKVLECIIKYYDTISYTNGLGYEAFLKMVVPQSVPQARQKVIKRKVIYETQSTPQQLANNGNNAGAAIKQGRGAVPPQNVIQSIVLILDLESNLVTFTEKIKVSLQNNSQQYNIINLFELMDTQRNGYLDFNQVISFIKKSNQQMVPNQYLGLLRRMKKPEVCETISFQDFKDFLMPILPYFSASSSYQQDNAQQYHEINRSLDHSQTQIMAKSMSVRNPQDLMQSQAIAASARNPYEDSQQKVYFKDKHGRIVEKNHPHEPVFLKENPHFSEMLKQNVNIVHHPQEDSVYTLIPEQYFDAPPLFANKGQQQQQKISPLPVQDAASKLVSTRNYQLAYTDYQLPKVDPKDMSGVDPFFLRSTRYQQQYSTEQPKRNGIFDTKKQPANANNQDLTTKPAQTNVLDVDISKIQDLNAKRIIQQQQELIKQYQSQLSAQSSQIGMIPQMYNPNQQNIIQSQYYSQPLAQQQSHSAQQQQMTQNSQINRMQPKPLAQQYQEMYNQNPFVQDIVQLRHANTSSYEPPQEFNSPSTMRNTNVLQDSFNAKINPFNHSTVLSNQFRASQRILGSAPNMNNSVFIETLPISTNQMQRSTVLNPNAMKSRVKSPHKKKIFDPCSDIPQNAQLNDQHYRFSNVNPYFQ